MKRRWSRWIPALLAAGWILLFSGCGSAAEGVPRTFRIRPQVENASLELRDGFVFLGDRRNSEQTAELQLSFQGRSPEGQELDLAQLVSRGKAKLLRAYLRVYARNTASRKNVFSAASGNPITLRDGWNLWDVTDPVREMLEDGEPLSFRLRAANRQGRRGIELDLRGSRIYAVMSMSEDAAVSGSELVDSELLDTALSALPEDHWALLRYREITGSLQTARWPTGVPYYYGGHSEDKVMHRFFPLQESKYYKSDKLYLCGFDCGSFLHWVEEKAGYTPHDSLSDILNERADVFPLAELDVSEWYQALQPGDMLVFQHGSFHAGMYLGTPRMFGLSELNAPDLAGKLDYPLMIHCGEDPFCYDRFLAFIESQDYKMTTSPPDGGVTVSLLVSARGDAPRIRQAPWKKDYGYFCFQDQFITAFPLDDCTEMAWFRPE